MRPSALLNLCIPRLLDAPELACIHQPAPRLGRLLLSFLSDMRAIPPTSRARSGQIARTTHAARAGMHSAARRLGSRPVVACTLHFSALHARLQTGSVPGDADGPASATRPLRWVRVCSPAPTSTVRPARQCGYGAARVRDRRAGAASRLAENASQGQGPWMGPCIDKKTPPQVPGAANPRTRSEDHRPKSKRNTTKTERSNECFV